MAATQAMTAKQATAALKGLAGKGLEVEAEVAREIIAAKGATAGAGAKAMAAGGGAKGAGMAAGAKAAGAKAVGAKAAGAATTGTGAAAAGTTLTGATAGASTKAASVGGFLSAGKGLGLGLGLGIWGPVILGVVGAAAIYGYVRSRNAEKDQEDIDLADALAEV